MRMVGKRPRPIELEQAHKKGYRHQDFREL
jgi:hypothetical protein